MGKSTTAKAFFNTDLGAQEQQVIWDGLHASVVRVDSIQELQDRVRTSQQEGHDMLLIAGHQTFDALPDQNGAPMNTNAWISQHTPVPAFSQEELNRWKLRIVPGYRHRVTYVN
ncbi:hypothetical protein [Lacimicrobium sp. SS2-24]|uniref:hypothetical protein n=1 Tax=Lacimicrobium sp. SS2-24 TaxID=2005569 RepID=UPI00113053CF|nr:hypothetical protein [Lacimicrobium sp. SS2-24]